RLSRTGRAGQDVQLALRDPLAPQPADRGADYGRGAEQLDVRRIIRLRQLTQAPAGDALQSRQVCVDSIIGGADGCWQLSCGRVHRSTSRAVWMRATASLSRSVSAAVRVPCSTMPAPAATTQASNASTPSAAAHPACC